MFIDLQEFDTDPHFEADLCIVGGGAAGIAMATALAGTSMEVLLLESGGLQHEDPSHALLQVLNAGLPHGGSLTGSARVFGGATTRWAGQALPLEPLDFAERPWVPHSGWPLAQQDLAPYYRRAEALLHLPPGTRYDAALWRERGIAPPAFDEKRLRYVFSQYSPFPNFGTSYRRRLADAENVTVVLHATVTSVMLSENGAAVDLLRAKSLGGRRAAARARAYVLCCGGLDTPRLLLNSRSVCDAGVGNEQDLVGRFFQEHPNIYTATVHPSAPQRLQQQFVQFYRRGRWCFPRFSLHEDVQRRRRVLNAMAYFRYVPDPTSGLEAVKNVYRRLTGKLEEPIDLCRTLRTVLSDAPEIARRGLYALRHRTSPMPVARRTRLHVHLEQRPSPDSRITLAREQDALGMQRACLDWRVGDHEKRTIQVITQVVDSEMRRLNLGSLEIADWLADKASGPAWKDHLNESYHHMGGTRMATGPQQGVVDADCRVFGVDNLYISGSSVFPTSGHSNPTLTILALSLRLTDHLHNCLRGA